MFVQSDSDRNDYKKAIETAQQERDQLITKLKELEQLQQRLSSLESFIEKGKILLGIEGAEFSSPSASSIQVRKRLPLFDDYGTLGREKPVYLKAVDILEEIGKPMKLSEIAKEFHRRNWKLSQKNGTEVLRNSLGKKTELFKNEHGFFSLREGAAKNKDPEPK